MKIENIKFKAKSTLDGAWIQGDLIHKQDGKIAILRNGFNVSEIDPSTVCQFTGLKDEEGKEIFEGDLLAEKSFPMYEVGYIDGEFVASYIGENTFIFKLYALSNDCVVCGSKYDRKGGKK